MSQLQKTATYTGFITWGSSTNWSSARDATSASVTNGTFGCWSDSLLGGDGAYGIKRGFGTWDTSSIPDDATIHSVTLDLHLNDSAGAGTNIIYVVSNIQANNTSLTDSDYNKLGATSYGQTAVNAGAGYAISISLDPSLISKTGYTKFGIRQHYDYVNTAPPFHGGEQRQHFDGVGHTYPARLTINYSQVPSVTTGAVTDLKSVTATLGGNITDVGGGTVSTAGVCWALTANPTTASAKAATTGTTGAFTVGATGLIAGQLYHYRAYVTTENSTVYGADATFRTVNGGNFIPFL